MRKDLAVVNVGGNVSMKPMKPSAPLKIIVTSLGILSLLSSFWFLMLGFFFLCGGPKSVGLTGFEILFVFFGLLMGLISFYLFCGAPGFIEWCQSLWQRIKRNDRNIASSLSDSQSLKAQDESMKAQSQTSKAIIKISNVGSMYTQNQTNKMILNPPNSRKPN
jgi:hypothetical protein